MDHQLAEPASKLDRISHIRRVKAKSVRQQATAIYTRGGVANRCGAAFGAPPVALSQGVEYS